MKVVLGLTSRTVASMAVLLAAGLREVRARAARTGNGQRGNRAGRPPAWAARGGVPAPAPRLARLGSTSMSGLRPVTTSARLLSPGGTRGEVQLVATSSHVILDLEGRNYDTTGFPCRDRALANLSLETAIRLRELLNEAIAAATEADPAHPGLWSDSAVRSASAEVRRR